MEKNEDKHQIDAWRISGEEDCEHESLKRIGADKGNNEYFYCSGCGSAIVIEGKVSPAEERKEMRKEKEEEKSVIDKIFKKI